MARTHSSALSQSLIISIRGEGDFIYRYRRTVRHSKSFLFFSGSKLWSASSKTKQQQQQRQQQKKYDAKKISKIRWNLFSVHCSNGFISIYDVKTEEPNATVE